MSCLCFVFFSLVFPLVICFEEGGAAGRDKGCCDLTIPGLNPFAAASSATPSPSIPFEFGGLGTTPILGGCEVQSFGFGDFNLLPEDGRSQLSGGSVGEAAGVFGTEGLTPFAAAEGAARPRPASPATGTQAPKPTPATSPAPPHPPPPVSSTTQLDAFDDFTFGGGSKPSEASSSTAAVAGALTGGGSGNLFDFAGAGATAAALTSPGGVSGAKSVAGSINSAMDDLNAAIHAALNKSSPAMKIPSEPAATSGVSTAIISQLGFESPSKKAATGDFCTGVAWVAVGPSRYHTPSVPVFGNPYLS